MSEPWWEEGADKRPAWGFLPWSDALEGANLIFVIAMTLLALGIACAFCT